MSVRLPLPNLILCALCLGVAAPRAARAATVDRPGLDALLLGSGLVFEAEVLAVDPDRGASGRPLTRVSVTVVDVLVGRAASTGDRLAFDLPEGRLNDGRFVVLAGAPRFAPGHRYLVFYRSGAWHHTPVVGWTHGLLRRVDAGVDAVWVDVHGRCVAGLEESGWVLGPRMAGPAPVPAGWIGGRRTPRPDRVDDAAHDAVSTCLSADAVRRALTRRLLEMGHAGSRVIARQPADGGWSEAGEAA